MTQLSSILVLALSAPLLLQGRAVHALSSFQYLEVVKDFADAFVTVATTSSSDLIADIASKSSLFAEDVVGTIDIAGDVNGRDLSTEYLFGLFLGAAQHPEAPSPIGVPVSYNVTAAVVERNTVSAGIKFELSYPILNTTYPIELDAFLTINEKREISQYDFSFRRWAWATDTIVSQLTPYMAEALSMDDTNSSLVFQEYLISATCEGAMTYCNGTNAQYESLLECMETLSSVPTGKFYEAGQNNLVCRSVHMPMLQLNPAVHCSAVGSSGGNLCVDQDYASTVRETSFPQGFLAPKYLDKENAKLVSDIWASSNEKGLNPLLAISMSEQDVKSWDPTFYATCTFVYFLFFYFFAKATDFAFARLVKIYSTLPREHQKNVVMYAMTIIFTTVALALELVGCAAFTGDYHFWQVQCARTAGTLVVALYLFELIFRFNMRLPLTAHHVLTIFAVSLTITSLEYTQSITYMMSGSIWLFQATTEQPTFVGLIGYRLKWKKETVAWILKISSIQTFVFKSASAIALLVYWAMHQNYTYTSLDIAWSVFIWVIAVGLLLTQIWGSYVTYTIGARLLRPRNSPIPVSTSQVAVLDDLEKGDVDFASIGGTSGTATPAYELPEYIGATKVGDHLPIHKLT